jgi:alkylated DNA repair dioxygenase AlkB
MNRAGTDIYYDSTGSLVHPDLFQAVVDNPSGPEGLTCVPGLFPDHGELFRRIHTSVQWRSHHRTRESVTWGESYHYRRGTRRRYPLPEFLPPVLRTIHDRFGFLPNNCVANRYRSGDNTIGFHSDETMEMRPGTGVVIVSLGYPRHLVLRRIDNPATRFHYALAPGSAFHMTDDLQDSWQHGLLREPGAGTRISLSLRCLLQGAPD